VPRALVIGYGNPSRRDDGVGHYVVNALRQRLGQIPLGAEEEGFDKLGQDVDTLCLQQLIPELAETVAGYDLVIFVDAHTGAYPEDLKVARLQPDYRPTPTSHYFKPEMVLALAKALHGSEPQALAISIRGYDFNFGTELSPETRRHADLAVERILRILEGA